MDIDELQKLIDEEKRLRVRYAEIAKKLKANKEEATIIFNELKAVKDKIFNFKR